MVTPGVLPLQIIRGIAFESHILVCADESVTVTGTLSPNVTGTFIESGIYNGQDLWILPGSPATFLYVNPVAGVYVIAQTLTNAALTNYWINTNPAATVDPTGTYSPNGANTGTATVTDHPTNLTGWTCNAEVRRSANSPEVILNLAPAVTDPVNGRITIPQIDDAVTRALPATGNFNWDLVLLDPTLERMLVPVKGPFTISDNITQD